MENFQKEKQGLSLADRVRYLEKERMLSSRIEETKKKTRQFRWPFKWKFRFSKVHKKTNANKMLVIFLNKKNEIEVPKFMPLFDGNMIIWKNKPYEFDPRAIWTIKGVRKNPKVYLIKEIDRRPVINKFGKIIYKDAAVSNMNIDEIRARGDSTESDEFLIKAALKAQTVSNVKKKISIIGIIVIIVIIGGLGYFMLSGS